MTPIIIPAYEPDTRMIDLLETMKERRLGPVIIVDDGSGDEYAPIFAQAGPYVDDLGGKILIHEVNKGKGRALKTAFKYVLETYPDAVGSVTADSDGQHTAECITSIIKALEENPDKLIMGVRHFDTDGVPWKSRAGNKITEAVFAYVSGIHVTDTQTGLRGIPRKFMEELLDVEGERFEFEMQMLLESAGRYPIIEIPIKTVYDSKENHQTHFNPFADSVKIYKILGKKFGRYILASASSFIIDLVLFALLCSFLRGKVKGYVVIATVIARVISAVYNYLVNYKVVFESDASHRASGAKYLVLAAAQMAVSAALVTGVTSLISVAAEAGGPALPPAGSEVAVKAVVDTILFFVSYKLQQKYVFGRG